LPGKAWGSLYLPHWALQEACSAVLSLPFIPDAPIVLFHGVCARFLISSEENRYGYDYRPGNTGD
jgi:hypothetical protein